MIRKAHTQQGRHIVRAALVFCLFLYPMWHLYRSTTHFIANIPANITPAVDNQSGPSSFVTKPVPPDTTELLNEFLQKTPAQWCGGYNIAYVAPGEFLLTRCQQATINCTNRNTILGSTAWSPEPLVRQLQRAKKVRCNVGFTRQIIVTAMLGGEK